MDEEIKQYHLIKGLYEKIDNILEQFNCFTVDEENYIENLYSPMALYSTGSLMDAYDIINDFKNLLEKKLDKFEEK